MNHLAIYNKDLFGKDYIALMLSGERTLGIKFLKLRAAPYGRLHSGDAVYLKEASGPVRGRIEVAQVHEEAITDVEQIMNFLSDHADRIGIDNEQQLLDIWRHVSNSRYLMWWDIVKPEACKQPVAIIKRDRRTWVTDFEVTEELLAAFEY